MVCENRDGTARRMVGSRTCTSKAASNLLARLNNRQVHGSVCDRSAKTLVGNPFGGKVPARLRFRLSNLFPESALEAGIVFLGFSRCGRFLVTYTQSSELSSSREAQGLNYVYHLQWWLFRPQERARKLAEVLLFGEFVIWHPLYVSVNEWPSDVDLVVVFGYDKLEESTFQSATCYVTVTALPSTDGCRDCILLRKNLGEEYLGCDPGDILPHAQCLRHGMTVHTSCTVVPPFPKSNPLRLLIPCQADGRGDGYKDPRRGVRARFSGKLVLSTGNFIHAFKIHLLEPVSGASASKQLRRNDGLVFPLFSPPLLAPPPPSSCWSSGSAALSHGWPHGHAQAQGHVAADQEWMFASASEAGSDGTSVSESIGSWDESFCGSPNPCPPTPSLSRTMVSYVPPGPEVRGAPQTRRPAKFFARGGRRRAAATTATAGVAVSRSRGPDDAYAFVDEGLPASENLSSYRKKRLAERTYEFSDDLFSDENTEASLSVGTWSRRLRETRRIGQQQQDMMSGGGTGGAVAIGNAPVGTGPFRRLRSPNSSRFSSPYDLLSVSVANSSSDSASAYPLAVLRQLNHCPSSNLVLSPWDVGREYRDSLSVSGSAEVEAVFGIDVRSQASSPDCSYVREKRNKRASAGSGSSRRKTANAKTRSAENPWVAEFTRYYMDADDELISVLSTDFDDDDLGSSTGYHNALSLEVHGCAYGQMEQVSRNKVGRVGAPIVVFNQISMDMEEFCHRMAERICAEAGEKFWACEDFDVAVLNQNYEAGSLVCCAEMLVRTKHKQLRGAADGKLYSTGLMFEWHPWSGDWRTVTTQPLRPFAMDGVEDESCGSVGGLKNNLRSNWLPAQNMLRAVNREWSSIPTNANALPRRLDNLPVLREQSLECIREPGLGVEVNLSTRIPHLDQDSDPGPVSSDEDGDS